MAQILSVDAFLMEQVAYPKSTKLDEKKYPTFPEYLRYLERIEPETRMRDLHPYHEDATRLLESIEKLMGHSNKTADNLSALFQLIRKSENVAKKFDSMESAMSTTNALFEMNLAIYENGEIYLFHNEIYYHLFDQCRYVEITYKDLLKLVLDREQGTVVSCKLQARNPEENFDANLLRLTNLGDSLWDVMIQKADYDALKWILSSIIESHEKPDSEISEVDKKIDHYREILDRAKTRHGKTF